jgi:hypothetical protein
MRDTINNVHQFRNGFTGDRKDQFTYEGLGILWNYLEQAEADLEIEFEYDVVSFCCEYREASLDDLNNDYGQEFTTLNEAAEWLFEVTRYCGKTDKTLVFCQDF